MSQLPDVPVHLFGNAIDHSTIQYALVWNHPHGDLATYPNLRAIFSLGAGAEHLATDTTLPNIPIVLLADPAVARDMAAHTVYWVIAYHRHYHSYQRFQSQRSWCRIVIKPTASFRVGVLGLGRIGTTVGRTIAAIGYEVRGWDMRAKQIDGILTFCGANEKKAFLNDVDVLINCLPLTPETKGFINSEIFQLMPKGAFFVNISRGAVLDEHALLQCLDTGHIAGAALDAFSNEPLLKDHVFWSHPNIHITPHMSGATYATSAVSVIVENIRRLEKGEIPFPLFDHNLGY